MIGYNGILDTIAVMDGTHGPAGFAGDGILPS